MRFRALLTIGAATALVLAFAPARALPSYYEFFLGAGHIVEIWQTEGSPTEVHLVSFHGRQVDSAVQPDPVTDDCLELFRANVYEIACEVGLSDDPSLVQGGSTGVFPSDVFDYDPETGFTYREPGEITVALTFTGEGTPRPAEPPNGVGVCGLPPDIPTGVPLLGGVPIERPVSVSGELVSDHLGSIELELLTGTITQSTFAYAGACL